MGRRTAVNVLALGVLLLLAIPAYLSRTSLGQRSAADAPAGASAAVDPLTASVEAAQQRLAEVPGDHRTWAELGFGYVELARVTADPSYYAKAEGAFDASLGLEPVGNDLALTGQGALANARHDFAAAADLAGQALGVNPYSAGAWGVLTDARTQLGDYAGAREALDHMLALQPGVASFARASYDAELHGALPDAIAALEQALDRAASPSDEAFCRTYLGALAFSAGDLDEASREFAAGLVIAPGNPELLLGQARVLAARGEEGAAVAAYRSVVGARPLPEHLAEFGNYLEAIGREAEAQEQFALVDTVRRVFAANGVRDDLGVALFAADHGDPTTALAAAEAEFDRRQNVDAHDALAWALHSAGRDAEALPHAQQATALGGRNALFLYHRGVIEAAVGQAEQARTTLAAALATNPYFSPFHAPRAAELLSSLGGAP
jgi:tetratricopeptide (TPR) repeat protein